TSLWNNCILCKTAMSPIGITRHTKYLPMGAEIFLSVATELTFATKNS
ncbi:unnamed protein product, partial [marine sediment metagenome]